MRLKGPKSLFLAIVLLLALPYGAHADDYPRGLLGDREDTLLASPGNDFRFEAQRLVARASDRLVPVEGTKYESVRLTSFDGTSYMGAKEVSEDNDIREKLERQKLTPQQFDTLNTAYTQSDGEGAYAAGDGLPGEIRAYAAGAVAFGKGDFTYAADRFGEALATTDGDPTYKVWADFMLGRTAAKAGDYDKAIQYFTTTRDLVADGVPDPLGLGVASFGEEARVALDRAGGVAGEGNFKPDHQDRAKFFHEAIRLYGLQAASGSTKGLNSLHILAKDMKNVDVDFALMKNDELARRLFLVYVRGYFGPHGKVDDPETYIRALLPLFPAEEGDFADRAAAAAYEIDNLDLADRYARQAPGVYSTWVEAKLAIKKGDLAKAAQLYDAAYTQKDSEHPTFDGAETLAGERATLTLARGDYVGAFTQFYPLGYWRDAAYLAERVLTIDELKAFIDKQVPEPSENARKFSDALPPQEALKKFTAASKADQIRSLLARRLIRTGKTHEALQYFAPAQRSIAVDYVKSLDAAASSPQAVDKAETFYKAAVIELASGPELLGREIQALEPPFGQEAPADELAQNGPYVTQGERDRFLASRGESPLGHSFRAIAASEATQAADLLPPRSQAFAAVLCQETHWIKPVSQEQAEGYYRRYVNQGAIVPWATHFGHRCPDPDFVAARSFGRGRAFRWVRRKVTQHPVAAAILPATVALAAAGFMIRRRIKPRA